MSWGQTQVELSPDLGSVHAVLAGTNRVFAAYFWARPQFDALPGDLENTPHGPPWQSCRLLTAELTDKSGPRGRKYHIAARQRLWGIQANERSPGSIFTLLPFGILHLSEYY